MSGQWLLPVITATGEAEIGESKFKFSLGNMVDPIPKKLRKKRWWGGMMESVLVTLQSN